MYRGILSIPMASIFLFQPLLQLEKSKSDASIPANAFLSELVKTSDILWRTTLILVLITRNIQLSGLWNSCQIGCISRLNQEDETQFPVLPPA